MQIIGKKAWLGLLGMCAVAAALLYHEGAFSENRWGANHFPNVELTDQYGRKHQLYDDLLKGKSVAVNTFFAGCGDVCPLGTAKMLELQKLFGDRVGKDIFFYSVSVDPANDTPKALREYADRFKVGPGWLFLTGDEKDIRVVMRKLGLGVVQQTSPREAHSTTLMIGDEPTGRWMRNSVVDNPRFLAPTIETFLGWEARQPVNDYTKAGEMHITNGQFLFNNGCKACHTIGGGDKIGPDLMAVTERRERQWLEHFILLPDETLKAGDPIANELLKKYRQVQMPNLGLARDEVRDILAHIDDVTAQVRARDAAPSHDHHAHHHHSEPAQAKADAGGAVQR